MRIAVLGTGGVGQVVAARLAELGHEVTMGTRDVAATLDRGTVLVGVRLLSFRDAAMEAEVIVNATSGQVSLAALGAAGEENLAGKVLVDLSNPLDFSAGFPPTLFVKDTDSLGEQIQAAFPEARVVKALNTLTADLMVHPELLPEGHTLFVSGNDPEAKELVTRLLLSMGHTDVIDLGDITTARGTEMFLALWVRAMSALGTPMFNIRIVR